MFRRNVCLDLPSVLISPHTPTHTHRSLHRHAMFICLMIIVHTFKNSLQLKRKNTIEVFPSWNQCRWINGTVHLLQVHECWAGYSKHFSKNTAGVYNCKKAICYTCTCTKQRKLITAVTGEEGGRSDLINAQSNTQLFVNNTLTPPTLNIRHWQSMLHFNRWLDTTRKHFILMSQVMFSLSAVFGDLQAKSWVGKKAYFFFSFSFM